MTTTIVRKIGISVNFFNMGFMMGNWVARMPSIKADHDLNNGQLGGVLVGAVGGALLCLPVVTYLCKHVGSRVPLFLGGFVCSCSLPFIGLIFENRDISLVSLILALIGVGFGLALIDISAGSQAILCEKDKGVQLMGFFHCFTPIGSVIGVLLGGFMAKESVSPFSQFCSIAVFALLLSVVGYFCCYAKQEEDIVLAKWTLNQKRMKSIATGSSTNCRNRVVEDNENPLITTFYDQSLTAESDDIAQPLLMKGTGSAAQAEWPTTLYLLGIVGFICYITESAMSDWSILYVSETLHAPPLTAAACYALFSFVCICGLVSSDYLISTFHVSPISLLYIGAIFAIMGLSLLVLSPSVNTWFEAASISHTSLVVGFVGVAFIGCGVSLIEPVIFSMGGKVKLESRSEGADVHTGTAGSGGCNSDTFANQIPKESESHGHTEAIAFLSIFTYMGYLIGPALLGCIAQISGEIRWAFSSCIALSLLSLVFIYLIHRSIANDNSIDTKTDVESNSNSISDTSSLINGLNSFSPNGGGFRSLSHQSLLFINDEDRNHDICI